jgi:hypothetical protein
LWPEVDRGIDSFPTGTRKLYLKYSVKGMALDDIRLALFTPAGPESKPLLVTHNWYSKGSRMSHGVEIKEPDKPLKYLVRTNPMAVIRNLSIVFECPLEEGH